MNEFTKNKFHSLSNASQHKILAKLLNELYRLQISGQVLSPSKALYELYSGWIETGLKIQWDNPKSIADGYHFHLRQANIQGQFLPAVAHFDREEAEEAWPIHVYLDQLRSAHNVGSILRTAEGFGFDTVLFSKDTPWIDNKQVQKTSCNAYLFVNCQKKTPMQDLKRPLVVLETALEACSLYKFTFPRTFTLAIGNEEYGCSDDMLKTADYIIKIPMRGRKNSLNVANAFAATASEISRQRN
ncbi:putative tRNA (Guanosine-2'-O-)-methyltransferase [Chlamydiales bacterium STE3]|nr:putative tRNA (Guanosine-2'-O-)-methyltransferase [Chlamydiales bacterium STE3]